jgi:hypothetical protein
MPKINKIGLFTRKREEKEYGKKKKKQKRKNQTRQDIGTGW